MKHCLNLIIFLAILLIGYLVYVQFSSKPEEATPKTTPSLKVEDTQSASSKDESQPEPEVPQEHFQPERPKSEPIPQDFLVYMTLAVEDQFKDPNLGKIVIRLYSNTPKTAQNFLTLCEQKKYANTKIHRVIKNFMIQSGDFTNQDGTGGYSIYGQTFEDENFINRHNKPGLLSMANAGPNTNGSQFFITTAEAPHLDNKHVVFGEVISGMEYIYDIENQVTNHNDEPVRKCFISDCGIFNRQELQTPEKTIEAANN